MEKKLCKSANVSWKIYLAIFALIYSSKDTCYFGVNISSSIKFVSYIVTLLASLYLISQSRWKDLSKVLVPYIPILCMLISFTILFNFDLSIKYGYEILMFVTCGAIVCILPFEKFKYVYLNIIFLLAIVSVAIYIVSIVSPALLNVFPIQHNENGFPFRFCILSVVTDPEYGMIRNYGIFREPGVYIVYLCIGLIFELFSIEKIRIKRIMVLLVAICTTLSTAGFIVTGFMLFIFVFMSRKSTVKQKIYFASIVLIGLLMMARYIDFKEINEVVFGKLFTENDSTASRTGSIYTNLNMWLSSLSATLIGVGFTFVENEFKRFVVGSIGGGNNTNTIVKMLAVHGVFYVGIIYSLMFKFCRRYFKNISFIIMIALLMLQSNEDLIVSFHTYLLPIYALANKKMYNE